MEISKEQLSELHFPKYDVLTDEQHRAERMRLIGNAVLASNLYKVKANIKFVCHQGTRSVVTTIWHCTDKHVVLKGGRVIPVHAIVNVS
ncbi:MAG: hypothetical protein MUC87_03955 [Bacteroidia bacterium]|jgi:hypothetical protein|nr:hypothetical protein [Bacteroidia bacterium]